MAELLSPITTKNSFFLTLSTYNDEEKFVDARVDLHKSSKILNSTGAYLAAESFKISCGCEGGIEYLTVPTDWKIYVERVDPEANMAAAASKFKPLWSRARISAQPIPNQPIAYAANDGVTRTIIARYHADQVEERGDPGAYPDALQDLEVIKSIYEMDQTDEYLGVGCVFTDQTDPDDEKTARSMWKVTQTPYLTGTGLWSGDKMISLPVTMVVWEQANHQFNAHPHAVCKTVQITYDPHSHLVNDEGFPFSFGEILDLNFSWD